MNSLSAVIQKSEGLVSRFDTRDPFEICRRAGIKLFLHDDFQSLKGMYRVILRSRCIFLNNNLSEEEKRIVLAHELGHDALHRAYSGSLQDSVLWDFSLRPEYEANLFAANLLLSDGDVLELVEEENLLDRAAARLGVPPELLALKLTLLREKGHPFPDLPHEVRFLTK